MKRLLLVLVMCFGLSGVALAVVNINTATKQELISLKGVSEKRAQEIIDYCREKLAVYKAPAQIAFVNELPKSATGKILKRVLRQQA